MYKLFLTLAVFVALGVAAYLTVSDTPVQKADVPEVTFEEVREVDEPEFDLEEDVEEEPAPEIEEPIEVIEVEVEESTDIVEENEPLPAQFNLAVPFTSQAPHSDWNLPYQEACEEASSYMVSEYYKGRSSGVIDPDEADAVLLDVVDFQEDFLGFYLDTTAEETVSFIDPYFGYFARVVEEPTVEMIKREIASGKPVILPAAGQQLRNPFFSGDGPLYHMIVIKGYTETEFIVNDPGTRHGENFVYDISVIMEAMGDWNNGDPANGAKRVIFTNF